MQYLRAILGVRVEPLQEPQVVLGEIVVCRVHLCADSSGAGRAGSLYEPLSFRRSSSTNPAHFSSPARFSGIHACRT